uniref:AMP_N domain-containing protein n=1 Tax=Globodera pallida TaxID=36090 RepID=A0A183CJV0_GLOPA
MPKMDMEKCQPTYTTSTPVCTASNHCPTRALHPRHAGGILRSSPIIMLLLVFCCLMAQHRNGGADAFLLAHRKMFVPFASTRIGALKMASSSSAAAEQLTTAVENLKNAVNKAAEFTLPTNLVGFLVVPKNSAIAGGGKFAKNVFPESVATHDDDEQIDDDELVNDDAKPVKSILVYASGSEEQNTDSAETFTEDEQLRMVKRMHHLSILRKIGSPGANIPASRLFGPLRQRELKRRAWMIQY